MGTEYVALDLETTGLDLDNDAIIEIGAVRFDANGVLATYETLVDPCRPIPLAIQTLTGITGSDVSGAPFLGAIASEVETFLDGAILVGHNVLGFDTLFLEGAGIKYSGAVYDTQELAALLLPGVSEYGLAPLAAQLEIPLPVHHRAPGDAEATRLLFLALQARARSLSAEVLDQVSRWLGRTALPWAGFFGEIAAGAGWVVAARMLRRLCGC